MELVEAIGPGRIDMVRELFAEYRQTPGVDDCVEGFSAEIEGLPGEYGPPLGALMLALAGGKPAGCIALRPLEPGICEMKRLYVRQHVRGAGLGRKLVTALLDRARELGYDRMRLDSLPSMTEAIPLYESLGFRHIAGYGARPLRHAVHMEIEL